MKFLEKNAGILLAAAAIAAGVVWLSNNNDTVEDIIG